MGTPSGVIVKWRSDEPTESIVFYGTHPDDLLLVSGNLEQTTEHAVQVSGLDANTQYFYSIGSLFERLAGGDEAHSFVTHPRAGKPKPTRIWAIGDCGTAAVGYPGSAMVRDAYYRFAKTNRTDVWLMLGDNAYYSGTDYEYQAAVFDTFGAMLRNTILWSTIGNHETYGADDEGRIAYHDIFSLPSNAQAGGIASGTENYYSFDYANIHFVCLDSELSSRSTNGPMWTWLQQDLSANTNDWLIAFWHSPPFTKGSHDSDNLNDNFGNMTLMRANFVSLLESYGVDLVLCGHSHCYERSYLINGHYGFSASLTDSMIKDAGSGRPSETGAYRKLLGPAPNQGAVYVVAGSSGWATFLQPQPHPAMYITLLQMGSMVIDINSNRLDARFLRETGSIDDHFTIIKGGATEPLRITVFQFADGYTVVRWKSIAGRSYQIEQASNLEDPHCTADSDPILASGTTTSWTNVVEAPDKAFYRVVQVGR